MSAKPEQTQTTKKPGFLKRRFQSAAARVNKSIPKTPWQAFKVVANGTRAYLTIPFTLKGVFLAVAFSQIVPPLTANIFPEAHDFLKNEGLDPKIADQLAPGKTIRIRERGALGTTHAVFDSPAFMGLQQLQLMEDVAAYSISSPLFEQCRVILPSRNITAKDVISLLSGLPKDKIENVPMTDKEAFYTIAFHEIRHCADENRQAPDINLVEGNADVAGAFAAAKAFNNPEIAKAVMYMRALSFEPTHDGTLYLDHSLNNTRLLFPELGASANDEVRVYMEKYYPGELRIAPQIPFIGGGGYVNLDLFKAYEALGNALKVHGDDMSVNARRRAELFREAIEYFAPSAVGKKPVQTPQIAPAVKPGIAS